MNLTILNRLDINIDWCFSVVSVGFTIHKRGLELSLIFFDISIYYFSPKWRENIKARYRKYQEEELDQA